MLTEQVKCLVSGRDSEQPKFTGYKLPGEHVLCYAVLCCVPRAHVGCQFVVTSPAAAPSEALVVILVRVTQHSPVSNGKDAKQNIATHNHSATQYQMQHERASTEWTLGAY